MAARDPSECQRKALPKASGKRFGLVVAQWHTAITERLARGATETLMTNGVRPEDITRWDVPGSFELIYGSARMLDSVKPDAIIAIGCLIRGETAHFDLICQGVTQGIKDLNLKASIPVLFCVLTDEHRQQSLERSGGTQGNKGAQCATAAIEMTALGTAQKS